MGERKRDKDRATVIWGGREARAAWRQTCVNPGMRGASPITRSGTLCRTPNSTDWEGAPAAIALLSSAAARVQRLGAICGPGRCVASARRRGCPDSSGLSQTDCANLQTWAALSSPRLILGEQIGTAGRIEQAVLNAPCRAPRLARPVASGEPQDYGRRTSADRLSSAQSTHDSDLIGSARYVGGNHNLTVVPEASFSEQVAGVTRRLDEVPHNRCQK